MPLPLVFLPTILGDARLFTPQISALCSGRTIIVPFVEKGENLSEIAGAVLAQLPARFCLVGAGFGGKLALEMANLAAPRIAKLALIAASPLPDVPSVAAAREPLIIKAKVGDMGAVARRLVRMQDLSPKAGAVWVFECLSQMAQDMAPQDFLNRVRAMQKAHDLRGALRQVPENSLILCGADDRVTPIRLHRLMAAIAPKSLEVIVHGAGHYPTLEQPEIVNETLSEWLSS